MSEKISICIPGSTLLGAPVFPPGGTNAGACDGWRRALEHVFVAQDAAMAGPGRAVQSCFWPGLGDAGAVSGRDLLVVLVVDDQRRRYGRMPGQRGDVVIGQRPVRDRLGQA